MQSQKFFKIFDLKEHLALYEFNQFKIINKKQNDLSLHTSQKQNRSYSVPIIQHVFRINKGMEIDFIIQLQDYDIKLSNKVSLFDPSSPENIEVEKSYQSNNKNCAPFQFSAGNSLQTIDSSQNIEETKLHLDELSDTSQTLINQEKPLESNQENDYCEEDDQIAKTDKKNIVKNFVKAFKSYLIAWGDSDKIKQILNIQHESDLQTFKKEFLKFEKSRKYNNKLMRELIVNQKYRTIFNYFLQNEAEAWLNKSQVQDKNGHKLMIQFYLKAYDKPDLLEKMKILKYRKNDN